MLIPPETASRGLGLFLQPGTYLADSYTLLILEMAFLWDLLSIGEIGVMTRQGLPEAILLQFRESFGRHETQHTRLNTLEFKKDKNP
ncbi:Hypothetical predicted protein [Olea europaea subsp. europaea]|uniref:Uncharacterized protein n=1 Tax=Olea europaea subsp. europaea TaxID=158383 RepID=A0A8S0V7J1_OLEEU|nr:Hypothetical predicted protein [Olea europaea subsp. europaea]